MSLLNSVNESKAANTNNPIFPYCLAIAAVMVVIVLLAIIIHQQKKLSFKEQIIRDSNDQMASIRQKLNDTGHIKEAYLGSFFNIISDYILKIEKLKRGIERKVMMKKYDDILLSFSEINIRQERENLFNTFDDAFLKIFPDYITVFNSMLKKEDQEWPLKNAGLSTDLRIFALMRLGISDCETVARILEYSARTIYVYKTRVKAKSTVSAEQFEDTIMAMKAAPYDEKLFLRKSA